MIFLNRHIKTFGRFFVLLFFVASSGFTLVLSHCTMESTDCCKKTIGDMPHECSMMDPPQASSGPAVTMDGNCHSLTVAGGLATDPTVVEKESLTRVVKLDVHAGFTLVPMISVVAFSSQPSLSAVAQYASPPPVEAYVLNSTFLI